MSTTHREADSAPDPCRDAVVVGVDGRECTAAALDWAVEDATRRGLPLNLVTGELRRSDSVFNPELEGHSLQVDHVLEEAATRAGRLSPGLVVRRTPDTSRPVDALLRASRTADTVVLGAHSRNRLATLLLGSTATQVLAHASCPVVVVRHRTTVPGDQARVVVGVDGSALTADAIDYAFLQAAARRRGLTVVHAWNPEYVEGVISASSAEEAWRELQEGETSLTHEVVNGCRATFPDVDVRILVVREHPVAAITAESETAELTVVGSHGWGDIRGLVLGSVSQGVLRRVSGPVAVVRARVGPQVRTAGRHPGLATT